MKKIILIGIALIGLYLASQYMGSIVAKYFNEQLCDAIQIINWIYRV